MENYDRQFGGAMRYFSVDRQGSYAAGLIIALQQNQESQGNEIVEHIHRMYPAGFSRHGARYLRDVWPEMTLYDGNWNSGILELLLEGVRQAHYPNRPCRYQSMFAWDSLDSALSFREASGTETDGIYELQPKDGVHRGDMGIYSLRDSFACIDHRLHLYWQGKTLSSVPSHTPRWEYVLPLPVTVGQRVS
jgi:hypothetical protein